VKLALYLGCTVQTEQYAYELSVRETFPRLGVELVDLKEAGCCGFPSFRNTNPLAWVYLSARNLALAEGMNLDILALCNGCHVSLSEVKHILDEDDSLKSYINSFLNKEGLKYNGKVKVFHTLQVLHDLVGVDRIKEAVETPLSGLKLAAHYGCHIIRPSKIPRPDDPENPRKLERLIEALGAEAAEYPERLDCCGSGLASVRGKPVLSIAGEKLKSLKVHGFDGMVDVCPFCHKIYDGRQRAISLALGEDFGIPVMYYTQLLGLAMGIEPNRLGLNLNLSPVDAIIRRVRGGVG